MDLPDINAPVTFTVQGRVLEGRFWSHSFWCGLDAYDPKNVESWSYTPAEAAKRERGLYEGKVVGHWTLQKHVPSKGRWLCLCSCGVQGLVLSGNLRSGHSKSCGHTRKEWNRRRR